MLYDLNLLEDNATVYKFDRLVLRTVCCHKRRAWEVVAKENAEDKFCYVLYGGLQDISSIATNDTLFPAEPFEVPIHYFEDYDECLNEASLLSTVLNRPLLNYLAKPYKKQ